MENQHRKIKGYRELTQDEIDLMNEVKEKAEEVGQLVAKVEAMRTTWEDENASGSDPTNDPRWAAIAKTQLQQGFMALIRSVAKPDFF